jgi:ATP-binding cassette subfamily B protein
MSGWVSFTAMGIFSNVGVIEDGMRTLAKPHGVVDPPRPAPLPRPRGAVAFENVVFRYGRERGGGLEGFSLDIAPGEKVALVGRSGAGKSTALKLLPRLHDVEDGRITLDGVDVREVPQDELRRRIAMVTQETAMFNRSALDNIRYGQPEASFEEAVAAAKQAAAHDFVVGLRDHRGREGYEAHLGEHGVKLSGGQRQRVALARAILKDAPVLALDEATAALDSETEAAVQRALAALMEGRTVLAIAHRLSTIASMDRIIVMDHGRIAEAGDHEALLARGGLYADLWAHQSGGFIGIDEAAE